MRHRLRATAEAEQLVTVKNHEIRVSEDDDYGFH